jgi:conjugal transfer pilus assembly protein TraV
MNRNTLFLLIIPFLFEGCTAGSFGCKGFPNSPICKSAVQAYKATDVANPKNPMDAEGNDTAPLAAAPSVTETQGVQANVSPRVQDPSAVRTPPKVLRIWIAPWEDSDGDLQAPSYVFTELEPRRWIIGNPGGTGYPTIKPLQVAARKSQAAPNADALADPLKGQKPMQGRMSFPGSDDD